MKKNTIENITEYAKNATAIEEPAEYSTGVKVGWTAPAKWWNWLMNAFSKRLGETYETVKSIHEEIKNAVGGTLDENSNTQLKNTLDSLGRVQEVNGKLPDTNGKVDVFAEDILGYAMIKETSGKYTIDISGNWDNPAVLPDGTLVAGSNSNRGTMYSTDKGVTWWASSQKSGNWSTPAVLSDGTLVAGSSGGSVSGIIYSTNKGVTWTASSQTSGNWHTPAVLSDGMLVAGSGSDGGIIYSINKGVTWRASSQKSGGWYTPAVLSDGTLVAGSSSGGSGIIYSTDKGVTWAASSRTSGNWNTPAVLPDGMLVAGSSNNKAGIIYSTAKGVTWTASSQTSGNWNTPAVLPDGTAIGSGSDGGIFWIILLVPAPNLEQVKNSVASLMLVVAVSTALPKSTKGLFVSQGQYAIALDTKSIYQASVSGDNISWTLVTSL